MAFIDDQLGRPTAVEEWKQVAAQSPNHPAAHLRLAQWSAEHGQWKQAEREFILAETYFNALGDADMVRAVSATRSGRDRVRSTRPGEDCARRSSTSANRWSFPEKYV